MLYPGPPLAIRMDKHYETGNDAGGPSLRCPMPVHAYFFSVDRRRAACSVSTVSAPR